MKHREVGVGAFLPAGEDATEAVEPGVGAFDDPASCTEAGLAFDCLRLLAAAADMRCEAELVGEFVDLGIVVAAVEAEPLRRVRLGVGRSIGIESSVARLSLKSFRFAPAGAIPTGTP